MSTRPSLTQGGNEDKLISVTLETNIGVSSNKWDDFYSRLRVALEFPIRVIREATSVIILDHKFSSKSRCKAIVCKHA